MVGAIAEARLAEERKAGEGCDKLGGLVGRRVAAAVSAFFAVNELVEAGG